MGLPVVVVVAALALPGGARALDMDGTYLLSADGDCAAVGQDGGALRIADGVFTGVESRCEMTRPVKVRDMDAQLFDMVCTGESGTWEERAMVMRGADGGLILVWDGFAFAYERCPDEGVTP